MLYLLDECRTLRRKGTSRRPGIDLRQTRRNPGEDGVPTGAYKLLPSAKAELVRFVMETLSGKRQLSELDARGKVILLFKDGDRADPASYRPIALLNTDYKILTGVITKMIEAKIPSWAIPKEQMARRNVCGTMHGMLVDKAHTETARKNIRGRGRVYNYSGWYDFKKSGGPSCISICPG